MDHSWSSSVTVTFTGQMVNKVNNDEFLANRLNKQRFIYLLGMALQSAGHRVVHAKDDADVPIVLHSIESVQSCDTVVVGEDTDHLKILLCYHADLQAHDLLFMLEGKRLQKSTEFGTSNTLNFPWETTCATNSCLFIPFWDVTPHPTHLELAKAKLLRC